MDYDAMTSEERKACLDDITVTHPKFVEAFLFIKRHHGNYRPTKKGNCKFLIGVTGAGKSFPLEKYAARFPKETDVGKDIRRVVYVSLPPRSGMKAVAVAILLELGISAKESWNYPKLLRLVIHHLQEQKVELLILDEFQHCVQGLTDLRAWEGADLVKEVLDRARCQVLCAGLENASDAREVNPQLGRRNRDKLSLTPYSWTNEQDRLDFTAAMKEVDGRLPFKRRAGLDKGALLNGIHVASDGHFGLAMDLLKGTSEDAIDDAGQSFMITTHLLYRFYRGWKDVEDELNPFKVDPDIVRARVVEDDRQADPGASKDAPPAVSSRRSRHGNRKKKPGRVPRSRMNFGRKRNDAA
jgi:Bacterial TniB protein